MKFFFEMETEENLRMKKIRKDLENHVDDEKKEEGKKSEKKKEDEGKKKRRRRHGKGGE